MFISWIKLRFVSFVGSRGNRWHSASPTPRKGGVFPHIAISGRSRPRPRLRSRSERRWSGEERERHVHACAGCGRTPPPSPLAQDRPHRKTHTWIYSHGTVRCMLPNHNLHHPHPDTLLSNKQQAATRPNLTHYFTQTETSVTVQLSQLLVLQVRV